MKNKFLLVFAFSIFLFSILSVSALTQIQGSYLANGLTTFYSGNDAAGTTLTDSLGTWNGVNVNNPVLGVTGLGNLGTAINYTNTTNSYATASYKEMSGNTNTVFWNGWIKYNSVTGFHFIYTNIMNGSGNDGFYLYSNGNSLVCQPSNIAMTYASFNPVPGQWYMITCGINTTGGYLYVNATQRATNSSPVTSMAPVSGTAAIGNEFFSGSAHANTYVDAVIQGVSIYNTTSLNQTAVNDHFSAGLGLPFGSSKVITISISSPSSLSYYQITQNPITFNLTITNTTPIANVSFVLDGIINITNTTGINGTYLFSQSIPIGSHTWSIIAYNTTGYLFNSSVSTIVINNFQILSHVYNISAYETSSQNFNITINTSYMPTSGTLFYNSSTYPLTITNLGGGNYSLGTTIDTPALVGINQFYYQWSTSIGTASTQNYNISISTFNQTVNSISLAYCSSAPTYLNFTFQDESNQSNQLALIPASTFNYWLGSGTTSLQYLYSNPVNQSSFAFCLTPNNLTINSNYTLSYQGSGYPIRTYINTSSILSSSGFNKILYMLSQSNGIAVTFQVINPATQPLSGVFGTATGTIGGTSQVVGNGISGADGGITFFVNPLLQYTFTFSKAGYNTFTLTTTPAQSSYTITLGGNSATQNDYTKGISYNILPQFGTILNTSSNYNFTFNLNSSYWTVTNFGYLLYDQNNNLVNSTSSSNNGGILSAFTNTTNDTSFTMNYFYVINGTYINGTIVWTVNTLTGTQYSIYNSFIDLQGYLTSGNFYGLTSFGLGIMMFLVIFITTGTISWKFGLTSPMSVAVIVFAQVLLYDIGLGLIPNPIGAIPHFPTVAIGLIIIGMVFRERTG